MGRPLPEADALSPDAVAAWLRRHPRFLADTPELFRVLDPPRRVHGEILADHMAAMVAAGRAHAAAMAERADGVLAAGRATAGLSARVQEAVLALIGADDVADCIASAFPAVLAVDAASLCAEPPGRAGARTIEAGMVARLLGTRAAVFTADGADARLLHGEAAGLAQHVALVRVPADGAPMLLSLSARDPLPLDPAQGAGPLVFLGRAVAAALRR